VSTENEQEALFLVWSCSLWPMVRINFEHCINSSNKLDE